MCEAQRDRRVVIYYQLPGESRVGFLGRAKPLAQIDEDDCEQRGAGWRIPQRRSPNIELTEGFEVVACGWCCDGRAGFVP